MSSFHSNDYSPSYPAAITSAQATARYLSSPMTSEPDPIVPEFSSPSMIPMVSFLPSPPPLTSDMPNSPGQRSYSMQPIHNASVARLTPLSPTTSFLTPRAVSPTPSFRSNDTTDYIFPPSPRIPLAPLSRQVSQHSLSPTTPSDSAAVTSIQTTVRHISSPVTSEPDPSAPMAASPIPELVLTSSDDDAGTIDAVFSSPSLMPIVSLLPSPPPRTSDMPPTDPLSSPTPSSSQFDKLPPEKEPPSRGSTTSIPIHIRRSSEEDDPSAALSVAKDDASDYSLGLNDAAS